MCTKRVLNVISQTEDPGKRFDFNYLQWPGGPDMPPITIYGAEERYPSLPMTRRYRPPCLALKGLKAVPDDVGFSFTGWFIVDF